MCWDFACFQVQKDAPWFPEGGPEASVESSALRGERCYTSWWEGACPGVWGQAGFSLGKRDTLQMCLWQYPQEYLIHSNSGDYLYDSISRNGSEERVLWSWAVQYANHRWFLKCSLP